MTLGIPSPGPKHAFGGTGAQCALIDGHDPVWCVWPAGPVGGTDGHHGLSFPGSPGMEAVPQRPCQSGRSDTGGCPDRPFLDAGPAGKAAHSSGR